MLFNSINFAIFLPIVFLLYWFVCNRNLKLQNLLIVIASYTFYGWWDWRFLGLIILSTIIDYSIGVSLSNQSNIKKRKILLWTSIIVNIGLLGFFKYYNFFLENLILSFAQLGIELNPSSLKIILPVGISFYTFQTLSYTIDVYKEKLTPTKDFIAFTAFVCFFPQLVAGPIERATNLLPQFYTKRKFDYNNAIDGLRQILWGLFKKVVIADNCAIYSNMYFNNYEDYSGSGLALGVFFFTIQIYGDFSGYSDIAIGTSRLFGFNLMKNFSTPFFSRDIGEYWRRWHISLSTWFRDYIYIPLGGSKGGNWMKTRNIFVIFLVSGFWHGANWTYVLWGALNALFILPYMLISKSNKQTQIVAENSLLPSFKEFFQMTFTFSITVLLFIVFRSENISMAFDYTSIIFSSSFFQFPDFPKQVLLLVFIFTIIEWFGRMDNFAIEKLFFKSNRIFRISFYYILVIMILWYGGKEQEFIYFQF